MTLLSKKKQWRQAHALILKCCYTFCIQIVFHLISNRLKTLTTRAEFLVYLDEKTSSNTKYLVGKFD